ERAEAHDVARIDTLEFAFEPPQASGDLGCVRALVQAPLAAQLELEMLDDVRDVHVFARDADLDQGIVEQFSCGTDEGMTAQVLAVAGLLADHEDARRLRAFAEHGLCRIFPKWTRAASARRTPQRRQRDRRSCGHEMSDVAAGRTAGSWTVVASRQDITKAVSAPLHGGRVVARAFLVLLPRHLVVLVLVAPREVLRQPGIRTDVELGQISFVAVIDAVEILLLAL